MSGVLPPGEVRMSLVDHLTELRRRLIKFVVAALLFGVAGLAFARPLFGLLMQPVLAALPEDARALVYTSGIEEVNVLLKVGFYAGLFAAAPVFLWQLWGFVAPGLLPEERRYATPFVLGGSLAFLGGVLFCYWVILPPMFQLLLEGGADRSQVQAIRESEQGAEEALRRLRLGAADDAARLARAASRALGEPNLLAALGAAELEERRRALGTLVDAVSALGSEVRPAALRALERRERAGEALAQGRYDDAGRLLEESLALLAGAAPAYREGIGSIWALERQLAGAHTALARDSWTRPMLTMSEQLSLVLVLELAFGAIFELPLAIALLAALGVIRAQTLFRYQRHAVVVCLVVAALVTPTGDVVNLMLMTGPLILCYELGALAAWLIERRRARSAPLLSSTAP